MAYAGLDDLYLLGLGAQAFVTRPRPVLTTDVSTSTGVIRLEAHGIDVADLMTFRVTSGGTLLTGITAFELYSPEVVSFDLLRVIDPITSLPITSYISAGTGGPSPWAIAVDPRRRLLRHLDDAAAQINDRLTAHAPPIEPDPVTGLYPQVLVGLNARLAASRAVTTLQLDNPISREPIDRLAAQIEIDWKNLDTYLAGRPINPRPTDQTAIADNGARACSGTAVAWTTGYM